MLTEPRGRVDDFHGRRSQSQAEYILPGSGISDLTSSTKQSPVLEIGCYSGYSALAWYEGTKSTQAEIITLELSPEMIAASREAFNKYNVNDRIKLIEGPAADS